MSYLESALKKVIRDRLTLVPQFPYFRYYLNLEGDFLVIWKDSEDTYYVAKSNAMKVPSMDEFSKIPIADRSVFNAFDGARMAVSHFVERLKELDEDEANKS